MSTRAHFLRLLPSHSQSTSRNEFSGKQIKGGVTSRSRQPNRRLAALTNPACVLGCATHTTLLLLLLLLRWNLQLAI